MKRRKLRHCSLIITNEKEPTYFIGYLFVVNKVKSLHYCEGLLLGTQKGTLIIAKIDNITS